MKVLNKHEIDLNAIFNKLSSKNSLGDYQTEESFKDAILNQDYIVFSEGGSAGPCRIVEHPTGLVTLEVHIATIFGKGPGVDGMREIMLQVEEYCNLVGIDRIVIRGRKGLSRVLPDFSLEHITLTKDLEK